MYNQMPWGENEPGMHRNLFPIPEAFYGAGSVDLKL
jgi:hypothetical protein